MRSFIDENPAKYLYNTLIHPLYGYCDFIYDGCNQSQENILQIAQNNALRAVKKCQRDYPTSLLHSNLMIDDLKTCRIKSTLKIVYREVHNQGPPELNQLFNLYIPGRSLRSEQNLCLTIPRTNTKFSERDIAFTGCHYWNSVSYDIKNVSSLNQLKNKLKPYGLDLS